MKRRTLLTASAAAVAIGGTGVAAYAWADPAAGTPKAGGEVRENLRMKSQMLGSQVAYSIYLPPGYDPDGAYPVLYLMHGSGGDCLGWLRNCKAKATLDAAITEKRLPPTVAVFGDSRRDPSRPSPRQELTYNVNDADGKFRYADMFVQEFIPYIESEYAAGGSPQTRAMGGLSMGGFGALSFAMNNPGTFSSAFGLSIGHWTDKQLIALDQKGFDWRFARSIGRGLKGQARINDNYRSWNLVDVVNNTDPAELSKTPYYLDCGKSDSFLQGTTLVDKALTTAGVAHEFTTHSGGHDPAFWTAALPRALAFTAKHLGQ